MRILIVKTSSLGDVIQSFELLAYLREKFPDSKIDWVVEKRCSELLKRHPYINRIIEINSKERNIGAIYRSIKNLRQKKYDFVFDIQGNIKSGIVLFFTRSKCKIGFKDVKEWPNRLFTHHKIMIPSGKNIREDYLNVALGYFKEESASIFKNELYVEEDEKKSINTFLAPFLHKQLVLVLPGSCWDNKCLDRGKLLAYLNSFSHDTHHMILAYGSLNDERDVNYLQSHLQDKSTIYPKDSLIKLYYLMSQVNLVIAVDSLPLHLAALSGVRTISFFGPSSHLKYAPVGDKHLAFQGSCPYFITFDKRCKKLRSCPSGDCIKNLNPLKLLGKQ